MKRQRLLAVLLCLALVVALLPAGALAAGEVVVDGVAAYNTLQEAINSTNGGTITLQDDIVCSDDVNVTGGKQFTLDLNAHNITFAADKALKVKGGSLNVTGQGIITSSHGGTGSYYSTLYAYGSDQDVANYSVVTIGPNVIVDNQGSYGVVIGHTNYCAYGAKVVINGTVQSTYGFSVTGNAKATTGVNLPEIYVSPTGRIISDDGAAIYAAGYANYIIAGELYGTEFGIEIRAGNLTVEETAKITCTGNFSDPVPNGNGSTVTGAAIAVSQHTTNLPIHVNIKGGTITATGNNGHALYEIDTVASGSSENVAVSVSGGTFSGGVFSMNKKADVTGGVFSKDLPADCLNAAATYASLNNAGTQTYYVGSSIQSLQQNAVPGSIVTVLHGNANLDLPAGVQVINNSGNVITVNGVVVGVGATVTSTRPSILPPVILTQPQPTVATEGTVASFAVTAVDPNNPYTTNGIAARWMVSYDGGTNWRQFATGLTGQLPVTMEQNGALVRCVLTNASMVNVYSNSVSVTVLPAAEEDPGTVVIPGDEESPEVGEGTEETLPDDETSEELPPEEDIPEEDLTEEQPEVPQTGDELTSVGLAVLVGVLACAVLWNKARAAR